MSPVLAGATVVGAPPRLPLQFGLFSVLAPRPGGDRWENGVVWEALKCELLDATSANCDTEFEDFLADFDNTTEPLAAEPFSVYGDFLCSPVGPSLQFGQDKALEKLLAYEEKMVEEALWNGAAEPNLTSGALDKGEWPTVWEALAAVEEGITDSYGTLGVIHMGRRYASLLTSKGSLTSSGGRLFTKLGTPVVAGAGYDDSMIVGTGALFGYRSEITYSSNRPGDLLDRSNNNLYAVAERRYLIGFDDCGHVSATVAAPTP